MVNRFTPKAQAILSSAKRCAEKMGHSYIGSEHLILGILSTDCVGKKLLEDKRITYASVYNRLVEIAGTGSDEVCPIRELTPKCKKIIEGSGVAAKRFSSSLIGTEHILYSLCEVGESVGGRILTFLGLNLQILKNEIAAFLDKETDKNAKREEIPGAPILSAHSRSLNELAHQGKCDPLIGRERELDRLIQILCRRTKNNPCLIGDAGVGKTAIAEGLATRIAEGAVPSFLMGKTVASLDLPSMIAGTKYRGEFEERMRGLINELTQNDSLILFIDEIHTIMGAGGAEGAIDASNILKPALARGQIQIIGATTRDEYRRYIEKDCALERRLQPIFVGEPTEDEAINMLKGIKERYEDFHKVTISDEIIESAVKLSIRYIPDRYLPDKAIDIIDEGCSIAKMKVHKDQKAPDLEERLQELGKEKELAILSESFERAREIRDEEAVIYQRLHSTHGKEKKPRVSPPAVEAKDIEAVVSQWTGIPVQCDKGAVELERLEERLKSCIIGQDEAIESVSASVKRGLIGLKKQKKPIGSFLFLGPSGVGKTETAKVLAKEAFAPFGDLIRLDMSEYSEKHTVSKLIGAPAGYVGYEDEGVLIKLIRQKPYSVVLFDEIEKAHPDIYNILLQILDEGELTSSHGRVVSFKNAIIILTSNIGASSITKDVSLGFSHSTSEASEREEQKKKISSELKRTFRPELINRLDEIVIFNKLSPNDAARITELLLNDVQSTAKEIGIELSFDSEVCDFISSRSYDSIYGARPLKRGITRYIETPLSEKILRKEIQKGDSVSLFVENGKLIIGSKSVVMNK